MSSIHRTTMTPTKLDLLAAWLPRQPWFRGEVGRPPLLARAGGFRLDDPAGEVGLEFMAVGDTSGATPVTYHVPLTYRGTPPAGGEGALVGTSEHGVLGRRWVYDGAYDPVLTAQLLALPAGAAVPQAQSVSDTPDPTVTVDHPTPALTTATVRSVTDDPSGTALTTDAGRGIHLTRVLTPSSTPPPIAVTAVWLLRDATTRTRGPFATLHPETS